MSPSPASTPSPWPRFDPPLPGFLRLGICCLGIFLLAIPATPARGEGLEGYVQTPDAHFAWREISQSQQNEFHIAHLNLTSQKWRDHVWTHPMMIVRPTPTRHPQTAFLFVSGDGDPEESLDMLQMLAGRAGVVAAILPRVPNQPLYDNRKEDALIAFTFAQYLKTEDATWPLLFPMVKSAVRAMDAMDAWSQKEHGQRIDRFVVAGASKRGWTTYLTAAVDPRVAGMAPMVIDMLNMKKQLNWADKVYGRQSEEISDYTKLNLHMRLDEPAMVRLRSYVDPYAYRERYTMPKLILLGTNDPYWTVDSLRHYWHDLPDPKWIFQTPNAGHGLNGGREAMKTLAVFLQRIAAQQPLPKLSWEWQWNDESAVQASIRLNTPAQAVHLWTAHANQRDFRRATWSSQPLAMTSDHQAAQTQLKAPESGFKAFLLEATLEDENGRAYRLSTEARVLPDTQP